MTRTSRRVGSNPGLRWPTRQTKSRTPATRCTRQRSAATITNRDFHRREKNDWAHVERQYWQNRRSHKPQWRRYAAWSWVNGRCLWRDSESVRRTSTDSTDSTGSPVSTESTEMKTMTVTTNVTNRETTSTVYQTDSQRGLCRSSYSEQTTRVVDLHCRGRGISSLQPWKQATHGSKRVPV